MIHLEKVTKIYNKIPAINDVTIDLQQHVCTALVGVNGAGKTTLIDLLLDNLHPDKGIIKADFNIKQDTGILYQKTEFPELVKVKELYTLYTQLYDNPLSLLEFKNITRFDNREMNQYASRLSGGQQRILDFALATIGKPKLIIMDEPTSAMDAKLRKHFWEIIASYKEEGKTIIYTTHYLEELEKMADRVIVLRRGEIIADNSPINLRQQNSKSMIHIPTKYSASFNHHCADIKVASNEILIVTEHVHEWILKLIEMKINLNEIEVTKVSLADYIFESEAFVS